MKPTNLLLLEITWNPKSENIKMIIHGSKSRAQKETGSRVKSVYAISYENTNVHG
jgi:hypothetical protein